MNFHLDPSEFTSVISAAVDATIRRLQAEMPRDKMGTILVDKRTAARMMATSEATIDRWRACHGLPFLKLDDGKVWFRPEALQQWAATKEAVEK